MNTRLIDLPFYRVRDELDDSISFVVHCNPEDKYLLIRETNTDTWWLPSMQVWNKNWKLSTKILIHKIFIKPSDVSCGRIIKLCKVWQPPPRSVVYHCVFLITVEEDLKKPILINSLRVPDIRWITFEDLRSFTHTFNILSPEVINYFSKVNIGRSVPLPSPNKETGSDFEQYMVENSWRHTLTEITESYAIITSVKEWPSALSGFGVLPSPPSIVHQELIRAANFSEKGQCIIYEEFLWLCFPSLFMNRIIFKNFLINMGWNKSETPSLFRAADVFNRGALSYRDFIYFLAALEPVTCHGGSSGHLRCRYLFRYLDENQNNMLDYDEFKVLQRMILASKNLPTDVAMVEKEAKENAVVIGIGPNTPISRDTFLNAMGQLKLRGSCALLRSPVGVIEFLTANTKIPTVQPQPKNWTSALFKASHNIQTTSILSTGKKSKEIPRDEEYKLNDHIVLIDRTGKILEIHGIEEIAGSMSVSSHEIQHNHKLYGINSVEILAPQSVSSALLSQLNYFESSENQYRRASRKRMYNWGELNLNTLGSHMLQICDLMCVILKDEPRLLQLSSPIYVFGDLHGNFADLRTFSNIFCQQGPLFSPANFLFLGDYVDRGDHGVEVIAHLFSYKVISPQKFFLIRGNHEIREVQQNFTFFSECINKFGNELGSQVWESINKVFDCLPIAAVIDHKIFCCHGGIPTPNLLENLEDINKIPCPLPQPEDMSPLAWNIMWNDPLRSEVTIKHIKEEEVDHGFLANPRRHTGHLFTSEALNHFFRIHELSHLIRAHEIEQAGYQIKYNKKLITVFSSSSYCGGSNNAGCVFVGEKKIRIFLMGPKLASGLNNIIRKNSI